MSERRPEVRHLLESYLSSDSELFRAVAASILFEGTNRAWQYVSEQRLFSEPSLPLKATDQWKDTMVPALRSNEGDP